MAEPKIYIVEAPVKDFCGIGAAGIHFAMGKAEVKEGWVLDWFKEHGYTVTEKPAPAAPAADSTADPLDKMKIEELKAYAEENGIDLGEAKKKDEILAAIKSHQ